MGQRFTTQHEFEYHGVDQPEQCLELYWASVGRPENDQWSSIFTDWRELLKKKGWKICNLGGWSCIKCKKKPPSGCNKLNNGSRYLSTCDSWDFLCWRSLLPLTLRPKLFLWSCQLRTHKDSVSQTGHGPPAQLWIKLLIPVLNLVRSSFWSTVHDF